MSICCRRARIDDRPALEIFVRSAYPDLVPFKGPDRWRWQFLENPFLPNIEGFVPVWVALDGDNIVGQIAIQATDVHVAGRVHSAGWVVDVIILPAYRGRGIGHLLHEAVVSDVPTLLTLTMAPATRRMAERAGAITLGPTWQFSRWVRFQADDVQRFLVRRTRHHRYLTKIVQLACGSFALHHMLALLINPWLSLRDRNYKPRPRSTSIAEVERFNPTIDGLWQRVAAGYPAICPRNSRFLNWRFVDCPQLVYHLFQAYRDGALVGYSVLRCKTSQELRQGVIVDLFANRRDPAVFRDLICHAVEYFGDEVASVECATSLLEIESILSECGFFKTRTLAPTIVVSDESLRSEIRGLRNEWSFSKGDHDWDQIDPAADRQYIPAPVSQRLSRPSNTINHSDHTGFSRRRAQVFRCWIFRRGNARKCREGSKAQSPSANHNQTMGRSFVTPPHSNPGVVAVADDRAANQL
jgi:GNAT superfamily N-acetyltransferase